MWQSWRESVASDIAIAVVLTAVTLVGAYGEAHPNQPSDKVVGGPEVVLPCGVEATPRCPRV